MAELKSLSAVAIGLLVIGLVLGIGFVVLAEFEESLGTTSITVSNETLEDVSETTCNYVSRNSSTAGFGCYNSFAVVYMQNATDGATVTSTNYTVFPASGCILGTSGSWVGGDWNITYTFLSDNSSACDGIGDTVNATSEIPGWLSIVVILLIVGVLMYLVFNIVPKLGSGSVTGAEGTIAQI